MPYYRLPKSDERCRPCVDCEFTTGFTPSCCSSGPRVGRLSVCKSGHVCLSHVRKHSQISTPPGVQGFFFAIKEGKDSDLPTLTLLQPTKIKTLCDTRRACDHM